jgi:hypothetical protein
VDGRRTTEAGRGERQGGRSPDTAAAGVRRDDPYPQRHDLSQFRVAGYDNELLAFTEPVEVWCTRCGTSMWLGDFAATVRNCGAALDEVVTWAKGHACSLLRLALSAPSSPL